MNIAIIGAGTMGTGIAELAAGFEHQVILVDTAIGALDRFEKLLHSSQSKKIVKGQRTEAQAKLLRSRIDFHNRLEVVSQTDWIFEAIVEDINSKKLLFKSLSSFVGDKTPISSNTSSLSVTDLASSYKNPSRVVGVHFFNPAPEMALVEIIPGMATSENILHEAQTLIQNWGKHSILAKDYPGFVVNRIARPYYLEALRIVEEGIADIFEVDASMKHLGFKMGPFELMDFVGNDINYTVTDVIYRETGYDSRYRPFILQKRMVQAGWLGRKSGKGYYKYSDDGNKLIDNNKAQAKTDVAERILCMLINEAILALQNRTATRDDIDMAMVLGLHYPKGLLQWADEWGVQRVYNTLQHLFNQYMESRYRPAILLRQMAENNQTFYAESIKTTNR
ncbi:MAG: 3-hydroxybutyryl-CoA dehydrogenase [Flavobacteriales bacterium]|nr:3-hydroxybutyryl-CoA dehydrogenase [Flavobacteriales bacterium]